MVLEDVFSKSKWTPLNEVVDKVDYQKYVGQTLYRLCNGIYLYLTPFRNGRFESDPAAPFLAGVFCIPDDGAAKRILEFAIEQDQGAPLNPPAIFIPPGALPHYGSILEVLKKTKPKVCQETASYRIASDGHFVHRTIETERYTFYFRSAAHDDNETPFAILYKF